MRAEGGTSLYGNGDIPNFSLLTSAITEAGVGDFSATALRKALAGKSIRLTPSISSEGQRIAGSSSVKDIETMLQLAHLYFMAPRKDSVAFEGLKNRTLSFLKTVMQVPRWFTMTPFLPFSMAITCVWLLSPVRFLPRLITGALWKSIVNASAMLAISNRFIGKIDMAELRPLLCQYLATLPSTYKKEETDKKTFRRLL